MIIDNERLNEEGRSSGLLGLHNMCSGNYGIVIATLSC